MGLNNKKAGLTAAGAVLAGGLIVGGSALAIAATNNAPAASGTYSQQGYGYGAPGERGGQQGGQRGGHTHTPVTGDELAKVTAAVKAKDSAVTVNSVQKDPDGSYDVDATKAGAQVRYEVSADLKTITEGKAGGKGGRMMGTPITGAELTKVTAAVKAKDSAVTVSNAAKMSDGSYAVFGTKAGERIAFKVSADLKTITEMQGRGGHGPGGGSNDTPVTGTEATTVTNAVKAKDSAVTVTEVRKDPDGSYDVLGTKAGAKVFFEVSKDLKTITQR